MTFKIGDRVSLARMPPERDDENHGWVIQDLDDTRITPRSWILRHPMGATTYAKESEMIPAEVTDEALQRVPETARDHESPGPESLGPSQPGVQLVPPLSGVDGCAAGLQSIAGALWRLAELWEEELDMVREATGEEAPGRDMAGRKIRD